MLSTLTKLMKSLWQYLVVCVCYFVFAEMCAILVIGILALAGDSIHYELEIGHFEIAINNPVTSPYPLIINQ